METAIEKHEDSPVESPASTPAPADDLGAILAEFEQATAPQAEPAGDKQSTGLDEPVAQALRRAEFNERQARDVRAREIANLHFRTAQQES